MRWAANYATECHRQPALAPRPGAGRMALKGEQSLQGWPDNLLLEARLALRGAPSVLPGGELLTNLGKLLAAAGKVVRYVPNWCYVTKLWLMGQEKPVGLVGSFCALRIKTGFLWNYSGVGLLVTGKSELRLVCPDPWLAEFYLNDELIGSFARTRHRLCLRLPPTEGTLFRADGTPLAKVHAQASGCILARWPHPARRD